MLSVPRDKQSTYNAHYLYRLLRSYIKYSEPTKASIWLENTLNQDPVLQKLAASVDKTYLPRELSREEHLHFVGVMKQVVGFSHIPVQKECFLNSLHYYLRVVRQEMGVEA